MNKITFIEDEIEIYKPRSKSKIINNIIGFEDWILANYKKYHDPNRNTTSSESTEKSA